MEYSLFRLTVPDEWKDIMIAELADLGFDMMEETPDGVEAVVEESRKKDMNVKDLMERYSSVKGLKGEWSEVESVNWNEEWEKNYDPVNVEGRCLIRADFHSSLPKVEYEVIINPRMSFGTGHHSTTWLMVYAMLQEDLVGKSVIDAGCGTGILAILAKMMGAADVIAYDVSQLCVDNTIENAEINHVNFPVQCCTIAELDPGKPVDLILANINRNALLDEIPAFASRLAKGGKLFLSGFFTSDGGALESLATSLGLIKMAEHTRNDWSVLMLRAK